FVDAAIYTCQRNANVYMDISEYERSPQVETYVKAMCTTISDKVLFASAHPFIELRDALDAYAAFPFTDEVRNKIMYENARKVLKLA
ncbi:MAG: amidohydrolase family protein, partial [Desulfovibrio sp.]